MTWFGWVLTAMLAVGVVNDRSGNKNVGIVGVLVIVAILTVGTGTGL